MKFFIKTILLVLVVLVYSNTIDAYNKPYITNFSKDKYGADNKNWSIDQDDEGIMYFGNDVGLLEFDGVGWTLNTTPNRLTVRSVSVLSHNSIFTGSYQEFGRWDRGVSGKLKYTSLSADLDKSKFKNDDFWKIWASDELVYFQSFASIYVYDYKTVVRLPFLKSILFLTKIRDEFWVQEIQSGIHRFKDGNFEKIEGSDIFSNTDVRVILPYQEDQYLIGTATKGVYIYDGKNFKELNPSLSRTMNSMELNCGILTSRGTYFFGTILNGIYEVDKLGNIIDCMSTSNTLQNNTVLSAFEDNIGNVWVGLDRGISYVLYLPKMSFYADPRGNVGSTYGAVLWKDRLFVGTNQGVFYVERKDLDKSNTLANMKLVDGTQGQVWAFKVIDDRLYCCHNRGLKEIHENLSVSDPYKVGTGVYNIDEATLKGKDVLLLSTYASLKLVDKATSLVSELNLIKEPVIVTEIDHLGNIWLEHFNRGVYKCRLSDDLKRVDTYQYIGGDSGDGLPYKLKIFKVGGRIVLLGDNKFYTYDDINDKVILNDRLNDSFKGITDLRKIVYIQDNLFWAMTGAAIYKFSYDGYNAHIVESYDIGARNLSLINAYENISILDNSLNLICLDNGFLLYDNKSEDINVNNVLRRDISLPFFESFKITNIEGNTAFKDFSKKETISYGYNTITISFSAKNTLAYNYSFQYLLEEVDKDWSSPQKVNEVSYARLPKGVYRFMVRAVDNLGNYSEPTLYEFEILPPWYQTVWAYITYAALIVGALLLLWSIILRRYRNAYLLKLRLREEKHLRRANEKLKQVVEEKNAELFSQTSFVIQRNELIFKIKEELEDFYKKQNNKNLAPLFHKVNMLLNDNIDTEEDWKMFLINFEQKHTIFFKKLKEIYPQLTANDLRLCACLKLNLDSKEIASLTNISVRAVENSRSRLRKKLNLSPQQNLNDFFLKF